jgi:hypothetical protein
MNLIKLPGPRFINLSLVNRVEFGFDITSATVYWATGDAPLELNGPDALALVIALERLDYLDASMELTAENEPCLGGVGEYATSDGYAQMMAFTVLVEYDGESLKTQPRYKVTALSGESDFSYDFTETVEASFENAIDTAILNFVCLRKRLSK